MLTLHELEEILMGDITLRSIEAIDDKIELGKKCVHEVVKDLINSKEIELLLDEFNTKKTKEAIFCYHIDKIECDFQAKIYDLQGVFSYEKAREDLPFYGNRADEIDEKSKTASDFWIEYDRPKYDDDVIFKTLIEDIKNIEKLNNENIED